VTAPADALAARREALTATIARERADLAVASARLVRPLRRLQDFERRAVAYGHQAKWLLLPAAVLALLFPRRTLQLAATAFVAWRTLRPPPRRQD
jgi:hypothetical protein